MNRCVICQRTYKTPHYFLLCPLCRRSLDRLQAQDSTIWSLIEWTARRTRRCATKFTTTCELAAKRARYRAPKATPTTRTP